MSADVTIACLFNLRVGLIGAARGRSDFSFALIVLGTGVTHYASTATDASRHGKLHSALRPGAAIRTAICRRFAAVIQLEHRDAEFDDKIAEVLCVDRKSQ
jgi:hypothetical protein